MYLKNSFVVILIVLWRPNDVLGVIWPCESYLNCTSLNINATCSIGGTCICPPGKVYSTSTIACVDAVLFGEKCLENVQCSLMPTGLDCIEGECRCKEGQTYIRGQCKKLSKLEENCDNDLDCWFGYNRQSVVCKANKCACASGYYKRNSEICRKNATESEACVVHTDCDTQYCHKFVCMTNKDDKISFGKTTSENYNSKLLSLTVLHRNENYSVINKKSQSKDFIVGESCNQNGKQCEGLDYSVCVENVCYCRQGYYPHPTTHICMAELGEPANSPATCEQEIILGLCRCKNNFFYDENLRTCRKSIVFTAPCTADNQCSPYAAYCKHEKPRKCICPPYSHYDDEKQLCIRKKGLGTPCEENKNCPTNNSICSEDKICICKDKYYEVNATCLAGIGANCTTNEDCKIENGTCSREASDDTKSCMCLPDFIHLSNRCLKKAMHIEDDCVDSKQCEHMLANCTQNICLCTENEHYSYGKCEQRKYIGQSCSRIGECFMPSNQNIVECKNSICTCRDRYQTDLDGITCIKPKYNSSRQLQGMFNIFSYFFLIYSSTLIKSSLIELLY